jgi:hypothetical protein
VTSAPEPPPEQPSDPWALPTVAPTAPMPVAPPAPYLSSPPEPYVSMPPEPYLTSPPVPFPAPPQPGSPYPGAAPSGTPLSRPASGAPLSPPEPFGPSRETAYPAQPGPVIVQVGEIAVTSTMVHTPAGDIPLTGSAWQVSDHWHNEQKTPTWAIIMAVVGFCFLPFFSLLFLLAKETVYHGTVQITVTNGPRQYVARIPVTNQTQVAYLHQQVNYVRSLAAL